MLIIDMPKKYLTDASGFVSCEMCKKYLPLLYRDCHKDFKGCLVKGALPEEHGDLIDRDAFIHKYLAFYTEQERKKNLVFAAVEVKQQFADMICDERAVIAAERKDDGTTAD